MIRIGVLGLQGDVTEHLGMIEVCGAQGVEVRTPAALEIADGLIIPGGESPTIGKLLSRLGCETRAKSATPAQPDGGRDFRGRKPPPLLGELLG